MSWWERLLKFVWCLILAALAAFFIPILYQLVVAAISAAQTPPSCNDYLAVLAQAIGISCPAYQAAVQAYGWLMVIGLAAILLGLIIMVIRCFLSLFGPEEEEPSVVISGSAPLLLVRETATTTSPTVTLTAQGTPSGGSYRWRVVSGSGKVGVESGYGGFTFSLKATAADHNQGDVIIEVEYTSPDGVATDRAQLTVHKPSGCTFLDSRRADYAGPEQYGYEIVARYQILDQFGQPYPGQYLDVEVVDIILSNPYSTNHQDGNFTSDENAQFYDHYEVFSSAPLPSGFIFIIKQTYRASGFDIAEQEVTYGPTDITVNRIW